MKIDFTPIPPSRGENYGPIQVRIMQTAPATGYVQGRPSNLGVKTGFFPQTNAMMIALDAEYHALPQSGPIPGPNKDSWDQASSYYGAWQVCGCTHGGHDGQSLSRNWNFNRTRLGLGPLLTPLVEATDLFAPSVKELHQPPPPTLPWIALTVTDPTQSYYEELLIGKGNQNPYYQVPSGPGNPIIINPAPSWSDILPSLGTDVPFYILQCTSSLSGRPMLSARQAVFIYSF